MKPTEKTIATVIWLFAGVSVILAVYFFLKQQH